LYPNPARNSFTIEGDDIKQADIIILDNLSRKINLPLNRSFNKVKFDSKSLAKGIYLVQIQIKNKIETKKLIIK